MSVARDYKLGKIKNNYNQDDLNWYLNRALEDKEYLENYIEQVEEQIAIIKRTKFRSVVIFKRSYNQYSKKVEYYVWLEKRPQIEGIDDVQFRDSLCIPTSCHKCFRGGNLKKEAREYAKKLAQEHSVEIEMVGF